MYYWCTIDVDRTALVVISQFHATLMDIRIWIRIIKNTFILSFTWFLICIIQLYFIYVVYKMNGHSLSISPCDGSCQALVLIPISKLDSIRSRNPNISPAHKNKQTPESAARHVSIYGLLLSLESNAWFGRTILQIRLRSNNSAIFGRDLSRICCHLMLLIRFSG